MAISDAMLLDQTVLFPGAIVLAVVLAIAAIVGYFWNHAIGTVKPGGGRVSFGTDKLPVLGQSLAVLEAMKSGGFDEWLYKNTLIYNQKTWVFSIAFQKTFYVVHNPTNLEYILKTNFDNFPKGEGYIERLLPLLGQGIFNADGDLWYMQRKVASKVFNERTFRDNVEVVFARELLKMQTIIENAAQKQAPLDLHDLLHKYTLESFGHIGFGVGIGCLTEGRQPAFALAFDQAQEIAGHRFYTPMYQIAEVLDGSGKKMHEHLDVVYSFANKFVEEKLATQTDSKDLLSLFVNAFSNPDDDFKGIGQHNAQTLHSKETKTLLAQIVINLIIAGRDTTAQAMSWSFYHILRNPEATEKILEEVNRVIGPNTPLSTPISYDQVRQLKYTKAVFLESLRLQPSVPREGKLVVKDCTLPDGTFIPGGAVVLFSIYAMGRMESLWGPDAAKFRPERWLENDLPSPFKYPVFNAGPRLCLGKTMAETEATFVLAELTRRYKLTLVENQVIARRLSLTNPAKHGIRVTVQHR